MRIQPARPDDLRSIQTLLSSLDLPHQDLTPSNLDDFLVCRNGDDLIGVVGLERYEDVALLRSLAVHPAHRDQGIGTRLVEQIEQRGRDHNVKQFYLLTTTAADYFETHDYEVVQREALPRTIRETDEVSQICPASATTMRKELAA